MATGRPNSSAKATTSSAPLTGSVVPGTSGAPALVAMWRALTLSPRESMACGPGPDPDEAGVDDGLGEGGVLGEEAVAGVHGVGAGAARDVEQLGLVEVAVPGGGAAEGVGLVGDLDVQGITVGVGIDGDRGDRAVGARPGDADRDLPTIGDEDLADGCHGSEPSGTWVR